MSNATYGHQDSLVLDMRVCGTAFTALCSGIPVVPVDRAMWGGYSPPQSFKDTIQELFPVI